MFGESRIVVVVEGATEEGFVREVLKPHFKELGTEISYSQVPKGMQVFDRVKRFVNELLRDKTQPVVTTMFDLYALPASFPNRALARKKTTPYDKAKVIEDGMKEKIGDDRFFPYIQLYEFEGLLFSNPQVLFQNLPVLNLRAWEKELREIEKTCQNPEWINERADKAPSKRVMKHFPDYDKASLGPLLAGDIGLSTLREKCPHFNDWITILETLPRNSAD